MSCCNPQAIYLCIKASSFVNINVMCNKYIQLMETLYFLSLIPEENRTQFPIPSDT